MFAITGGEIVFLIIAAILCVIFFVHVMNNDESLQRAIGNKKMCDDCGANKRYPDHSQCITCIDIHDHSL